MSSRSFKMSEFEYKNLLVRISQRLDNINAGKQLVVICRGKLAARPGEENIPTFSLFVELEGKGFLSPDRLSLLEQMLTDVKEWVCLQEVGIFACKRAREKYNNLLEQIIRVLDELNDLERLISICRGNITEGGRASIHDVRSLFRELNRNGSLGIDCYKILKQILIQTEKCDLLEKVNELEQQRLNDLAGICSVDLDIRFYRCFRSLFLCLKYMITSFFKTNLNLSLFYALDRMVLAGERIDEHYIGKICILCYQALCIGPRRGDQKLQGPVYMKMGGPR